MSLNTPQLIAFDLDGTLVDTAPDLAFSVNLMLQELQMDVHPESKIRTWIGNGIEKLVHRAITGSENNEASETIFAKAFPLFMDFYAKNAANLSQIYPGVLDTLEHLKMQNIHLAVITNKRGKFTEILLKALNIYSHFSLVIAGDSLAKKKPDPMQLLHAADHFDVSPTNALMVGDSTNDVFAAKAAGFQVLCVDYGYNRGVDIRESEPDMVVSSLSTLKDLI